MHIASTKAMWDGGAYGALLRSVGSKGELEDLLITHGDLAGRLLRGCILDDGKDLSKLRNGDKNQTMSHCKNVAPILVALHSPKAFNAALSGLYHQPRHRTYRGSGADECPLSSIDGVAAN